MDKDLTIDARMLGSSGIGRYLRTLIPYIKRLSSIKISLLTSADCNISSSSTYMKTIGTTSSIYTVHEQLEIPKVVPPKNNLLWVPHYNIPLFYRGKLLVTVHDLAHLALPEIFEGLHKRLYARTMFAALKRRADQVICVSEFTKQELIRFTGIEEEKIKVVYNGIQEDWFHIEKEKDPEHYPYLLYVGNVKPHKNLHTLVEAFLKIHDKIPHNLVLVGQKEGFLTKDKRIDELIGEVPDRVKFTGYISDDCLKQYYKHADLFVFPSLYEGFGYPPLEAMAAGCPVVASNAASIPEICGEAAEYFDPLDVDDLVYTLETVLQDEIKKESLVQKGNKQAKKFSVDNMADQTLEVINSIS